METDDVKLAGRVDEFIDDLSSSKSLFSDVDRIQTDIEGLKKVAYMMLQHDLKAVRLEQLRQNMNVNFNDPGNDDYFG